MCVGARQKQFAALSLEAAAAPGRHFPRPARGRGVPAARHMAEPARPLRPGRRRRRASGR